MHIRNIWKMLPLAAALAFAAFSLPAAAQTLHATLEGYQEVPAASSPGAGSFRATIDKGARTIYWELNYGGLEGSVLQSHIHFGQHGVNGGISVFLCTNLGNGPAGTQLCPAGSANLNGMIMEGDVIGPAVQLLAAGEFDELVAAMLRGVTYANVHTNLLPGGEIRGQIGGRGGAGGQN
jgi:CHRD domain